MLLIKIIFICCLMFLECSSEYNNSMTRSYKGSSCVDNIECQELLGIKSLCAANQCQCVPHYHINNNNICIKDRGLKEFCQSNDECYWGPEMTDKIECNLGVCSCVPGYIPDHGKICRKYFFSDASVKNVFPILTLIMTVAIKLI